MGESAVQPSTTMDQRYPIGSRVVLLTSPFNRDSVRVLSKGFAAAGDPCVSWDGQWVYFAGKRSAESEWQIYRTALSGGDPEQLTQMPGGAMDPAIAAHDELVFSSPVPIAGRAVTPLASSRRGTESAPYPSTAIYGQLPGKPPVRFTFGPDHAFGATVLRDGRILFVTAKPHDNARGQRHWCLFAMNNDGTEITAYTGQEEGPDYMRRPRELNDGRIAFLSGRSGHPSAIDSAETVQAAAPFVTRRPLLSFTTAAVRSIEPTPENDLLLCVETRGMTGRAMGTNGNVYRVPPDATTLGAPVFEDASWNNTEATCVTARPEPQGHTTAVMPAAATGTVLCLNVNDSMAPAADGNLAPATQLRVFATSSSGDRRELGTVPVAADGSVLVRLPVKVPLGFETLDAAGHVLRHQPPFVWLHPGENRGCVGCHERRNHAPKNVRPLATQGPPSELGFAPRGSTPRTSAP